MNEEIKYDENSVVNIAALAQPGFLPNGVYTLRIREVKNGSSKSGNLMDTVELEIIAPETVEFAGATYVAAGSKVRDYWSYTHKSIPSIVGRLVKLGLGIQGSPTVKDLRAGLMALVGYSFEATVQAREEFEMTTLTVEQETAGEKPVELVYQGEKISRGWSLRPGQIVSRARAAGPAI